MRKPVVSPIIFIIRLAAVSKGVLISVRSTLSKLVFHLRLVDSKELIVLDQIVNSYEEREKRMFMK